MNILMLLTPKKNVTFLLVDQTIEEGLKVLQKIRYSSIPLLNNKGKYVGSLTEGDLLWHMENNNNSRSDKLGSISRLRDNKEQKVSANLDEIFITSLGQNFIPISDDRGYFIGIITRSAIINYYVELIKEYRGISLSENNHGLDAVLTRRSVRMFKDEKIDKEVIATIMKAGLSAPSAMNRETVHLLLIEKQEIKDKLFKDNPQVKLINTSPYTLMVFGDTSVEGNLFLLNNNCSAAIENILIALNAVNLGGVWIGAHPENENNKAINHILNIDKRFVLHGSVAFGVSDETKTPKDVDYESLTHFNKW